MGYTATGGASAGSFKSLVALDIYVAVSRGKIMQTVRDRVTDELC